MRRWMSSSSASAEPAVALPEPECRLGYTYDQLVDILGDRIVEFSRWMRGQTMVICDGLKYNHDTREYEKACGGVVHGVVVYPWDLKRFLDGRPIVD